MFVSAARVVKLAAEYAHLHFGEELDGDPYRGRRPLHLTLL